MYGGSHHVHPFASPHQVWGHVLTGQAECAVTNWVAFFTARTNGKANSVLLFKYPAGNSNLLDAADACARLPDLPQQELVVLFFLGLQFEEPILDLGPRLNFDRIQKNTYSFARPFVIKGQCIAA